MGSEVLSRLLLLLLSEEEHGYIHSIKVNRVAPPISHLMFADDIMIFVRVNRHEVAAVNGILAKYSRWSGQMVNYAKSALFCSANTNPVLVAALCDFYRLKLYRYIANTLDCPCLLVDRGRELFEEVKARVLAKVAGWKVRALSQAGRTTLIKSMATARPIYCMLSFLLPMGWCAEIDRILKDFW